MNQRSSTTFARLAGGILARPPRRGRTRVVAVDGGSGAGKSTFAGRLAAAMDAPVVHTDDVAWHAGFFDWTHLLIEGVFAPAIAGRDVRYRPPAWEERGRDGAIVAPAGPALVVEGVGAARRELAAYLTFTIWVDTDRQVAMHRGLAREGEDLAFWRTWELAEEQHLDADRPWERADLLVSNDAPAAAGPRIVIAPASTWARADRPTAPSTDGQRPPIS